MSFGSERDLLWVFRGQIMIDARRAHVGTNHVAHPIQKIRTLLLA